MIANIGFCHWLDGKKCQKVLCGGKKSICWHFSFFSHLFWVKGLLSVVGLKSIVQPSSSSSVSGWGKLRCTLRICWEDLEFRQTLHFLGTSLAEFYAESKMGILIHCKHNVCEKITSPRISCWIISNTKSARLATLSNFGQINITNEFFMSQYHKIWSKTMFYFTSGITSDIDVLLLLINETRRKVT